MGSFPRGLNPAVAQVRLRGSQSCGLGRLRLRVAAHFARAVARGYACDGYKAVVAGPPISGAACTLNASSRGRRRFAGMAGLSIRRWVGELNAVYFVWPATTTRWPYAVERGDYVIPVSRETCRCGANSSGIDRPRRAPISQGSGLYSANVSQKF